MTYQSIIVEKRSRLTIISINRPKAMNSLDPDAHMELDRAFNEFAGDPDAYVAILTSIGDKVFCSGNDLKYQQQHGVENILKALASVKGGFGGITHRFDCFKPVIAAVNGFALGGGTEIALACDIIVAAEHAQFGLPEPKVGLFAGMGGLHRLTRQIPYHLAMGYALTGRPIPASEALRMGMINEVVPASDLLAAAERWANEILQCAPLAVRASKQLAQSGSGLPLEDAMNREYSLATQTVASEDMREGIEAFVGRRSPKWQGR